MGADYIRLIGKLINHMVERWESFESQLYLWNKLRELKKEELILLKDMYYERIKPSFENAEGEADEHYRDVYDDIISSYHPDYNDIDPYDAYECARNSSIEEYEKLSLMRYNALVLWISLVCQTWEQQLIKFIKSEMKNDGYSFDDTGFDFNDIKEAFLLHNTNLEQLDSWSIIKELRWLVNVIKHGDGTSGKKLRKIRPDIFKCEYINGTDLLKLYDTSLLEETLKVTDEDLEKYINEPTDNLNDLIRMILYG